MAVPELAALTVKRVLRYRKMSGFFLVAVIVAGLTNNSQVVAVAQSKQQIRKDSFGKTADQQEVDLYTLTNKNGVEARIMTYGGIVLSLQIPDRNGKLGGVVLGYDNLEGYLKTNSPYLGAIIGRYGNRIAKGSFSLNMHQYTLARNNGENHLHGGIKGFDKVVWKGIEVRRANSVGVSLTYT